MSQSSADLAPTDFLIDTMFKCYLYKYQGAVIRIRGGVGQRISPSDVALLCEEGAFSGAITERLLIEDREQIIWRIPIIAEDTWVKHPQRQYHQSELTNLFHSLKNVRFF